MPWINVLLLVIGSGAAGRVARRAAAVLAGRLAGGGALREGVLVLVAALATGALAAAAFAFAGAGRPAAAFTAVFGAGRVALACMA